jgi:hypothetical protein
MTKLNSGHSRSAGSPDDSASHAAPETPVLIDPPPPATGIQKLFLAIMVLLMLGWLAFLAALARPKPAARGPVQEASSGSGAEQGSGVA